MNERRCEPVFPPSPVGRMSGEALGSASTGEAPAQGAFADHPLSYGQRALWFQQQMVPTNAAYNFVYAARIPTELDVPAFRRAFQRMVDRHATLRTTFPASYGEPIQRVYVRQDVCFEEADASSWSEAELNDRLAAEVYRPFDLAEGPLMRVFLFHRSAREHVVLLAMHHIVTDLWSLALFMREVGLLYTAEKTGVPARLEPLRGQYVDWVRQEAEMLAGPEGERLWAYWQKQLAGELPALDLPTDRPRPAVQTDRGAARTLRLGAGLAEAIRSLARAHRATPFMTLLAAFHALLHRYTGQKDILVASPTAGRSRETAQLIGYFVNLLVMRADLSGNPTFAALLDQVRQTALGAFAHSDYPFPLLVERLQPPRDPSRPPLVQVGFGWQKTTRLVNSRAMASFALSEAGKGRVESGALVLESMALQQRVVPLDLLLLMAEAGDDLAATVEYNVDLFDAATMARLLENLRTLLAGAVADPDRRISTLPLLSEAERRQVLVEWNNAQATRPETCIHTWFEDQVQQCPDAVALTFEDQALSYRALNRRANQLAHALRKRGVGPETLVGICMERSPEMIVGVLAVLKAGGAYVPLDPTYPPERLGWMIEDTRVPVVLTQAHLVKDLPLAARGDSAVVPQVLCLDADGERIAEPNAENPESNVSPDNLAYAIYTSGSTGRPKGALLHHRGLANFVAAFVRTCGLHPGRRMLQFASLNFDASTAEIFMALLSGATLCLARRETLLSPAGLAELLREEAITTAILPPSMLSVLAAEGLPALECLISAGEACSPEIVARWASGRRFMNGYGPTEASVGQAVYEVRDPAKEGTNIPIGRVIENMQAYVLDAARQPVPIGVPGEVHLGGVGLARGYLHRPDLTAAKFIPHPFSATPGARLYTTGDLARYRPDGNLEFLGRVDHQVKVRGYRVELGEIETTLARHPAVREAVVLAREGGAARGDKRLVAYVVPEEGQAEEEQAGLTSQALRAHLKRSLPDYMVPSAFVVLETLPLLPNGKVDRKALPVPDVGRPEVGSAFVAPQTQLEQTVAAVWQETLNLDRVGVHDNFFDLGGHSLKLAKIQSQLQERLGRDLSIVDLFRYPTIHALCEYLSQDQDTPSSLQSSQQRAAKQRRAIQLQQRRLKSRT